MFDAVSSPTRVRRSRGIEIEFLVERYHRAFEDEVAVLRLLLRARRDFEELADAVALLDERLQEHCGVQEAHLFPAFESGARCRPQQSEAWAVDALKLVSAVDAVNAACGDADDCPLVSRVAHLAAEVQEHIAAEAKVLAPWPGFEGS